MAKAFAHVRTSRSACVNKLHYVAKLVCKPLSTRYWQGMCSLSRSTEKLFDDDLRAFKTIGGTVDLAHKLANCYGNEMAVEVLQTFFSTEYAHDIGLHTLSSDRRLRIIAKVVPVLFKLAIRFAGEI